MRRPIRKFSLLALALAAVAAAVMAATAFAGVTVYSNDFSTNNEAKQLRHAEGKHCSRDWRKKGKSLIVTADRGKTVCGYRPPVEGDSDAPSHKFKGEAKLLKQTPKSVRDRVYVGLAVRSAKDTGYQLQVFPSEHSFKLVRMNGTEKVEVMAKGDDKAIKGTDEPNVLTLSAVGAQIVGRVNGKKVAKATDGNAGQVDGRKLELMLGYKKKRSKPASATFDDLEVQVPQP
jgi:hypothetical protein